MKHQSNSKIAEFFGINRAARALGISGMIAILLLVAIIAVNLLTGLLPLGIAKPDVTGAETFRISGKTVDWLKALDEDVTLYFICDGGKANADGDIYAFLSRYAEESARVKLEVVDSSSSAEFIATYGGEWPSNYSVIVAGNSRYKIIDNTSLYYYYNSTLDMTMTPEEYEEMLTLLEQNDTTGTYLQQFTESTTAYFDGESRVTNALNFVTLDDVPVAYVLTGGASALDASLDSLMSQSSYDLRTTLTMDSIPEDCDIFIINAPSADLTEAQATVLSNYLEGGGKLLLTTYYTTTSLPNLASVLQTYGLGFAEEINIVCDGNPNYYLSDSSASYPYYFKAHIAQHSATGEFDGEFICMFSHAIAVNEAENVTVTPWLYTSAAGYLTTYDKTNQKWTDSSDKGTYNVGVIAEKGDSKIIWISSPNALTSTASSYSENGNFDLAISAMNWMSGITNDAITIESKAMDTAMLHVTLTEFAIWGIILVVVIPIATAVAGIIIWYTRKKR